MNIATLENRLHVLIERLPLSNQSQQYSHVNSSSSIGTMIPTPGMAQSGNSNLMATSAVDNGNTSNKVPWNRTSNNNILVSQENVDASTNLTGVMYGRRTTTSN